MKKTQKSKQKDRNRTKGKIWVDEPVSFESRNTGSGVTFGGRYIDDLAVMICGLQEE